SAVGGSTTFFAAEWGQNQASGVFHSTNGGATWNPTGSGFPTNDAGRVSIGVQAKNPDVVYALVAKKSNGGLHGLYRLDGVAGNWKTVASVPDVLPLWQGRSQGGYDLAIAVDPMDQNVVYLGGSYANADPWPGSIWRCTTAPAGNGYK